MRHLISITTSCFSCLLNSHCAFPHWFYKLRKLTTNDLSVPAWALFSPLQLTSFWCFYLSVHFFWLSDTETDFFFFSPFVIERTYRKPYWETEWVFIFRFRYMSWRFKRPRPWTCTLCGQTCANISTTGKATVTIHAKVNKLLCYVQSNFILGHCLFQFRCISLLCCQADFDDRCCIQEWSTACGDTLKVLKVANLRYSYKSCAQFALSFFGWSWRFGLKSRKFTGQNVYEHW